MRAVFLHGGWRTGSTYVWNKFRPQRDCLSFYEPFNELLGSLSPATVFFADPPTAAFHHPDLVLPYFHEYLPLLSAKGHPLFRDEFAIRNYFVADQPLADQQAYVQSLLQLAGKMRKRPVLGCVRSLGRVGWFKRTFDGVNIVLIRSPVSQWVSGQKLAADHDQKFFDPMHFSILSQAGGSAAALGHAERHAIPRFEQLTTAAARLALRDAVEKATPARRFEVFASVYFLSYMAALPHADLVIDIDRLSTDLDYRAGVTAEIARLTGLEIDFSDARAPRHAFEKSSEVFGSLKQIRQEIMFGRKPLWADDVCGSGFAGSFARALIHLKFSEDEDAAERAA